MRAALLASVLLAGCGVNRDTGGDGGVGVFDATTTCGLVLELSGASDAATTVDGQQPACLSQHSSGGGLDNRYVFVDDGGVEQVDLTVDDVMEGEVGTRFPADLELTVAGVDYEAPDCAAAIGEHVLVGPVEMGDQYRVVGSVTCPEAASAGDGSGAVVIDRLDFVVSITWR